MTCAGCPGAARGYPVSQGGNHRQAAYVRSQSGARRVPPRACQPNRRPCHDVRQPELDIHPRGRRGSFRSDLAPWGALEQANAGLSGRAYHVLRSSVWRCLLPILAENRSESFCTRVRRAYDRGSRSMTRPRSGLACRHLYNLTSFGTGSNQGHGSGRASGLGAQLAW